MPIVLVQNPVIVNEGYDWKDIEGEQYHFPNQYKNRCTFGTPFVYYRGSRRPNGKRGNPEYFGFGQVGEVWRDESISDSRPKKDWAWFCRIVDYVPFPKPVMAKVSGEFIEKIAQNHWSVGIRPLPEEAFNRILSLAGLAIQSGTLITPLPSLSDVTLTESKHPLIVPRSPISTVGENAVSSRRYTRNAAKIGLRAEELVYQYLKKNAHHLGATNIRWISCEGLTPGWDIQYEDAYGRMNAVEVKGTTGPLFGSIDITIGEWSAAVREADQYWLYLVSNCFGTEPVLQRVQNPSALQYRGLIELSPIVYRLSVKSAGIGTTESPE